MGLKDGETECLNMEVRRKSSQVRRPGLKNEEVIILGTGISTLEIVYGIQSVWQRT